MAKSTGTAIYNNSTKSQQYYTSNLFAGTKNFKDVTKYNLMRGVPDFGSLVQFNPYETGYATFICCGMPRFIMELAKTNDTYRSIVDNWKHIVEYEFKTFDGLQDITADSINIGDDLNNMPVINKVNMQSTIEFNLTYDEKSGTPLTKFARLYLTGIKDPRTQVKTYHGLIKDGVLEPGFEHEVFTFLYIVTDNTMRNIEAAYLLIGCQLTSVDTDMFNYTKGTIDKHETQMKFTGYPITSPQITKCAKEFMSYLLSSSAKARQIIVNSNEFKYTGVERLKTTMQSYGVSAADIKNNYPNINSTDDNTSSVKYSSSSWFGTPKN